MRALGVGLTTLVGALLWSPALFLGAFANSAWFCSSEIRYGESVIRKEAGPALAFWAAAAAPIFPAAWGLGESLLVAGVGYGLLAGMGVFTQLLLARFVVSRPVIARCALQAVCLLPPLGLLPIPSSATLAGVLFPGLGVFGLATFVALTAWLISAPRAVCGLAGVLSVFGWFAFEPPTSSKFTAASTDFGELKRGSTEATLKRVNVAVEAAESAEGIAVLPENAFGPLTDTRSWIESSVSRPVLGGGLVSRGPRRAHVLAAISPGKTELLYRQRLPVPYVAWWPWREASFVLGDLFRSATVTAFEERVSALICYEAWTPWLSLTAFAAGAQSVVVVSDHWWKPGFLPDHMATHARALARGFGTNLVLAINTRRQDD